MNVTRPTFGVPVLCIEDFLTHEDAQDVLQECIDLRSSYAPASIFEGADGTKIDPSYRKNEVVYLDGLFRGDPGRSRTLTALKAKIWTREYKQLWHEGYYIFDIMNYSTWQEATISRYGDGAFYKKHRDTNKVHLTHRLVTLVYYINRQPEHFTGGTVALWHGEECLRLEPRHNRAVVFPSFAVHEVEKVGVTTDEWEHARFSINYWMGFR